MPYGIAVPGALKKMILSQSAEVSDQVESAMQEELKTLASQFGIAPSDVALENQASTSWIEEQGRQVDVIKRHGRLADLICVAKPDVDRNLGTNTLKAALFNTGRPVMMCPQSESSPSALCDTVAIAWNGSIEASRAVASTTAVLEQTREVVVLSTGDEARGADSVSLLDYLKVRGINARVERFEASRKIGQDLLSLCETHGIDTLIMGAYSSSHESETIFGGTTQYIVDHSELPVIFVH